MGRNRTAEAVLGPGLALGYDTFHFIKAAPGEAISIHSQISGISEELISPLFTNMEYDLILDQSLILDLESQAQWLIHSQNNPSKNIPNYLNFIETTPLKEIRPEAVTLVTGGSRDN